LPGDDAGRGAVGRQAVTGHEFKLADDCSGEGVHVFSIRFQEFHSFPEGTGFHHDPELPVGQAGEHPDALRAGFPQGLFLFGKIMATGFPFSLR